MGMPLVAPSRHNVALGRQVMKLYDWLCVSRCYGLGRPRGFLSGVSRHPHRDHWGLLHRRSPGEGT